MQIATDTKIAQLIGCVLRTEQINKHDLSTMKTVVQCSS